MNMYILCGGRVVGWRVYGQFSGQLSVGDTPKNLIVVLGHSFKGGKRLYQRQPASMASTLDFFEPVSGTAFERFIANVQATKIMDNPRETIIKVMVLNLLKTLSPIDVYTFKEQRDLNEERVKQITLQQEEEFKQYNYFGITSTLIVLGQCSQLKNKDNIDGIVVIDGAHRLAVLRQLRHSSPAMLVNQEILVKIHKSETPTELREYFIRINKNTDPVPKYNLDDSIKTIVDHVAAWFTTTFDPSFFKTSGRPQRPHVNLTLFKQDLSNARQLSDIIIKFEGDVKKTATYIVKKYADYNRYLSTKDAEEFAVRDSPAEYERCREARNKVLKSPKPLYLGLKSTWMTEALEYTAPKISIQVKIGGAGRCPPP